MAIPIRKELQVHVRKKRQDKMYTFNKIIHRLDEILDRYVSYRNFSSIIMLLTINFD